MRDGTTAAARQQAVGLIQARLDGATRTEVEELAEGLDLIAMLDLSVELALLLEGLDDRKTRALLNRLRDHAEGS